MTTTSAGLSQSFWERAVPVSFRYRGHTGFRATPTHAALRFAPNLAREAVFFDATVREPLKLREAMAMLHDVVVSDHRFQKKDRSAFRAHLERVRAEEDALRQAGRKSAEAAMAARPPATRRPGLDEEHQRARKRYWKLRSECEARLRKEDPALFRLLVPCDPIVTVAPDVVTFEAFAKDESSWGCVVVERDAFAGGTDATLGSTNVDYSLGLAEQMQRLRTYRETRFAIDPGGIEVETGDLPVHREEKIALPSSWLRGFGQLSAALMLPARRLRLPVATLYAVLAHLQTHREKTGPRALRFELVPGKAPAILVEPWGLRVDSGGPVYEGDRAETIAVWGRRRLLSLARALPLAQLAGGAGGGHVDVSLLGSGLPSVWRADLGGVSCVLALSGWTTSSFSGGGDKSGGARLDLLAGGAVVDEALVQRLATLLQKERARTLSQLALETRASGDAVRAAVVRLAQLGQVMPDLSTTAGGGGQGVVRFRQVLDAPLGAELLGEEPLEVRQGLEILRRREVRIAKQEAVGTRRFLQASAGGIACEALLDGDGVLTKARCGCSHFHRFGIRQGPCRHLLALRLFAQSSIQ